MVRKSYIFPRSISSYSVPIIILKNTEQQQGTDVHAHFKQSLKTFLFKLAYRL